MIANPPSLLAICIIGFWGDGGEAGIVALLLAYRGAAALPVFVGYFVLNSAVFLFLFQPLLVGSRSLPVPVLKGMVVLAAAAVIKMLIAPNLFQGDSYRGIGWFRSLVTSGIDNALSDLFGYIATRRPWEMAS